MILPYICVYIPVYNNGSQAVKSIESVAKNNYQGDLFVIVVDFNSTDNSYRLLLQEKIRYKFGLYQTKTYVHPKSRIGYMQKIGGYTTAGLSFVLHPGDLLLDNALALIMHTYKKYLHNLPNGFLFVAANNDKKLHVNSNKMKGFDLLDKVVKKQDIFSHRVIYVRVSGFVTGRWLGNGINNEACFLPDICYLDYFRYIKKTIVNPVDIQYEDEFEEVMYRFGMVVSHFRDRLLAKKQYIKEKLLRQLSLYSIWRASIAFKRGNTEDAKKCFDLAPVIFPQIETEKAFTSVKNVYENL